MRIIGVFHKLKNWFYRKYGLTIVEMGKSELHKARGTLVMIWLIWFGIFAAYNTLEVLQSSLNPGIGLISISLLYASTIITNLVAPLIILKLTPKWTVVLSCCCHTMFIAANYYPRWFTLIPGGCLVGIITGPFWTCHKLYITVAAVKYSQQTGQSKTALLSKFNGLVATALPLSLMCGSLVSSIILKYVKFDSTETFQHVGILNGSKSDYHDSNKISNLNHSQMYENHKDGYTMNCGPNYCPSTIESNTSIENTSSQHDQPHVYTLIILVSALGCFNLCSIFIAIFGLDNLHVDDIKGQLSFITGKETVHESCNNRLRKYLTTYFDLRFIFLIPAAAYLNLIHTMFSGMFPKAYITCSMGIGMIGFIVILHGLTTLITKFVSGVAGQYIHRDILFAFSYILVMIVVVILIVWDHLPNKMFGFYAVSTISGIAAGNLWVHFNVLLGDFFTDKKLEAFSFFNFTGGIITAIGFLLVNYICVKIQLYIYIGLMVVAPISYITFIIYVKKSDYTTVRVIKSTDSQDNEELQTMIGNSVGDDNSDHEVYRD